MKQLRFYEPALILGLLISCMVCLGLRPRVVASQALDSQFLARVEVTGMLNDIKLPVYAHLQSADGQEYALVVATIQELNTAGAKYTPLHDTSQKSAEAHYLIATEKAAGARQRAAQITAILHDDGRRIIVCVTSDQADALAGLGLEIDWMSAKPLVMQPASAVKDVKAAALDYSAQVAEMMDKVATSTLTQYVGNLSGVNSVTIGGSTYTITTRNTNNTTWSPRVTQFVYEYFQARGLPVQYHSWSTSPGKRNVIATRTGTTSPNEIVLLTAHVDDMPSYGSAPGADDNASGTAGVMLAAEIMKDYAFERTIRFVLFTGEEQGMYGSTAYADQAYANGENIVAVLNLDMIAWDSLGGPVLELHTRMSSNSGYTGDKAIFDTLCSVVNTYGLSGALTPTLTADGETGSDHSSFWDDGYSAVLAIENDADDFSDYYHTSNDKLSTLNTAYYTNFVKAAIGTAAHLAKPALAATSTQTPSPTSTPTSLRTYTPIASRTATLTPTRLSTSSG